MTTHCILELLDEPLELAFGELQSASLDVFFAAGFLAPLAPVLTLVATVGTPEPGQAQALVSARLDPHAQRVQQIGWFTPGEAWYPAQVFAPLIERAIGEPPELLLLSEQLTDEQRAVIAAQMLVAAGVAPARAALDAGRLLESDYLWPTLRALLASWQEASASPVTPTLSVEDFRTFLTEVMVASLWWPEPQGEQGGATPAPGEWSPASAREVRVYLHGEAWQAEDGAALVNVLRHGLMLYGKEVNEHDIAPLAALYAHAESRTDAHARAALAGELAGYAREGIVHAVVLLPMVVKDAVIEVVVPATAHLLACSPLTPEGERYAYVELRELLRHRGVANPGAVFASLLAHAEPADWPTLEALGSLLAAEQLVAAARIEILEDERQSFGFWLNWLERLQREVDEQLLSVAAATLVFGQRVPVGVRAQFTGRLTQLCAALPALEPLRAIIA